jgi:hypothetical protein
MDTTPLPLNEIIVILDRSGSMASIANDAIGGFNTFLKAQQDDPAPSTITLVLFDDQYEVVHSRLPAAAVPALTAKTFVPRGGTALLDAIGRSISDLEKRLLNLPKAEQPDKVIIAILTDGEENSSREWTWARLSDLISICRDQRQWEFIFLAANQDAIASAGRMNIAAKDAVAFAPTAQGTSDAFDSMTEEVTQRKSRRR